MTRRRRGWGAGRWPALLVLLASAPPLPQAPLELAGRVVDGEGRGVAGQRVVVHGWAPDGKIQTWSTTTGSEGVFRVRAEIADEILEDAEFLASTSHLGVEYSAPPVRLAGDSLEPIVLVIYDTAVHAGTPSALTVTLRRTFVRPADSLRAEMLDVLELSNPSRRTWVPGPGGALWTMALPKRAEAAAPIDAHVPASSLQIVNDTLRVLGPLPPGQSQIMIRYFIPIDAGPVVLEADAPVGELELLVAASLGGHRVAHLKSARSIRIGDQLYRRFTARNLKPGTGVRFSFGSGPDDAWIPLLLPVLLFTFVVAGAALGRLRKNRDLASSDVPR